MFQFWSFWNFNHFLSAYVFDIIPYTSMLDLSVTITSLIGGFMTYIYPKKLNIKY